MEGFRILIIEDKSISLKELGELLGDEFRTSRIDSTRSRDDARRLVAEACEGRRAYHLVIADLFLPDSLSASTADYAQQFLPVFLKDIWHQMPGTMVFMMTAYADKPEVKEYFAALDTVGGTTIRYRIFEKRPGYTYNLLKDSQDFLYGEYILRRLRGAFPEPDTIHRDEPIDPLESDLTERLREIRFEIQTHWRDLHPDTRERIRRYMAVDDSTTPPEVNLR